MSEKIQQAIDSRFKKYRLVFWYDKGGENIDDFNEYSNSLVIKHSLDNDEFALKYRILVEQPSDKFLVYSPAARPEDSRNWLLDLDSAECVFASDQTALRLEELEISHNYRPLVEEHLAFFQNEKDRRRPFKELLPAEADPDLFRHVMLSIACSRNKSERETLKSIKDIIILVAAEESGEDNPLLADIERFNLDDFFWIKVADECGYKSETPDISSLMAYLFKNVLDFEASMGGDYVKPELRKVFSFIDYWRNNMNFSEFYKEKVLRYQEIMTVDKSLARLGLERLSELDVFKMTDNLIVSILADHLVKDRLDPETALGVIMRRREKWWYRITGEALLVNHYQALEFFIKFRIEVAKYGQQQNELGAFWQSYSSRWFLADTFYRKFHYYYKLSGGSVSLSPLVELAEKLYLNVFMADIDREWHGLVSPQALFSEFGNISQNHFFKQYIKPMLSADKQVFIIASDALRYEAGAELAESLEKMKGLKVLLEPRLSTMPSITAAGMAVLMPVTRISITDEGSFRADGLQESGLENRNNILRRNLNALMPGKLGIVLDARAFMKKTKEEQMDDIKGYHVIYLFSNMIDSVADNAKSEAELPGAVEQELDFLTALTRKLTSTHRRRHVMITSDHGFLYQASDLHQGDLLQMDDGVAVRKDRRWAYGDFPEDSRFHKCRPSDVGFEGAWELRFPKGAFRIRKQGGGTRYVHGGLSIQEIMVPLISITQTREDDVKDVDLVSLITSPHITTNQLAFKIMQAEPVGGKILAVTIVAVIEAEDGTRISDTHELIFDSVSESEAGRTRTIQFELNMEASRFNNQTVKVVLYKKIEGQNVLYRDFDYKLNKMIEKDF